MTEKTPKPKYDRDKDNWYREPPFAITPLFEAEPFHGRIVDPCAGSGNIPAAARAAGLQADGYDLRHRPQFPLVKGRRDFLTGGGYLHGELIGVDAIISNPPYASTGPKKLRLEEQFLVRSLEVAASKVALLLPASWHIASSRAAWLDDKGLYRVYFCSPRISCPPGAMIETGEYDFSGGGETDYAWYVFLRGFRGPWTGHALHTPGPKSRRRKT